MIITTVAIIAILTLRRVPIIATTIVIKKPIIKIKSTYKFKHPLKGLLINKENFGTTIIIINNKSYLNPC